jgi:NAD(P)-dependent dehydrogenase (short-subunit alcohol dehydrogenase family)
MRWSVVTGGGGGMGIECARRLGREGPVLLAEFDEQRLEAGLSFLRGEGLEVDGIGCDVSRDADIDSLARAVRDRGGLRSVIHTAGLSPMMAPSERILAVNLAGTARIIQALVPYASEGSACVCISSMAGYGGAMESNAEIDAILDSPLDGDLISRLRPLAKDFDIEDSTTAYRLSKWGVQRLVRRKARDWAARGARIVSLSPGIIDTPMGQFENERQPIMKEIAEKTPLGRMGQASEIASVATFLCSEGASYVTGVDWLVDGGATHAFQDRT